MWKLKRDSHNPFLKERKERCGGGEVGETDNKQDRREGGGGHCSLKPKGTGATVTTGKKTKNYQGNTHTLGTANLNGTLVE